MESDTKNRNVHNAPPSSLKFEVIDDDFCNFSSSSSLSSPLQDFHHLDQFPSIKATSFDTDIEAFDPFIHGFDMYEDSKLINYEDGGGMQNSTFHGGGSMFMNFGNYYRNNVLMEMDTALNSINQNQNLPNPKPLSILVPDENSCITTDHFRKNGVGSTSSKTAAVGRRKAKSGKGQWTPEEDRVLIDLVEKYGEKKWSRIAQLMKDRIGKQCRERWHNHLRPDIKKDVWTEEEDRILIEAHAEIGNKWAEIAKRLAGRTENSIKNHWNATKRRQLSRRKCRTKWPKPTSILQNYIKSLDLQKSSSSRLSRINGDAAPADHDTHTFNDHVVSAEMDFKDYHEIIDDVSAPDFSFMDDFEVELPFHMPPLMN